ncbi:acyltransferase family protein [Streptomyces canus]
MSLIISWFVVPASHFGPPTGSSILVYGLLAQDMFTAPTPNGAFWSIGVEAELYLLFPLLLFVWRRWGAAVLVVCVALPVIGRGLMAAGASPVEGANWLAPNLAPVFVAGMVGAGSSLRRTECGVCPGGGSLSWPLCRSWLSASSGGRSGR